MEFPVSPAELIFKIGVLTVENDKLKATIMELEAKLKAAVAAE